MRKIWLTIESVKSRAKQYTNMQMGLSKLVCARRKEYSQLKSDIFQ